MLDLATFKLNNVGHYARIVLALGERAVWSLSYPIAHVLDERIGQDPDLFRDCLSASPWGETSYPLVMITRLRPARMSAYSHDRVHRHLFQWADLVVAVERGELQVHKNSKGPTLPEEMPADFVTFTQVGGKA